MKGHIIILLFSGIPAITFAQINTDSLEQKIELAYDQFSIDSLQENLALLQDSLFAFQKIDSIRNGFNQTADSIKSQYQNSVFRIDAEKNKINNSIDSLSHLSLPTTKYTKSLDSLNQFRQNTEAKFTSRLDALKSKTTDKLNALDLSPEYKEPLKQAH